MPPADPLDDRERRALGLALLALGKYQRFAKLAEAFAAHGVRGLRGLDDQVEEIFDLVFWAPDDDLPDPAELSPDARAALAHRLRAALAAEAIIDGRAAE